MRACLPLIKLLDVGLVEAAILWGFFVGQTLRGVKYAFPRPTAADHDPERHFPAGREFHFFWIHRWMHFEPIYKYVHSLHHKRCVSQQVPGALQSTFPPQLLP